MTVAELSVRLANCPCDAKVLFCPAGKVDFEKAENVTEIILRLGDTADIVRSVGSEVYILSR